MDRCDEVLERAATLEQANRSLLNIDVDDALVADVSAVLQFTTLVFENTSNRALYGSCDVTPLLIDDVAAF